MIYLASGTDVQYIAYIVEALCPQVNEIGISRWGIHPSRWRKLTRQYKTKSLRKLAREHGVSYETVRRALRAATS